MGNEETRTPLFSQFVMQFLGLQPGQVNGVLLVCPRMSSELESLFHALHTVKIMVTTPISYVINSSRRSQLVVKCNNLGDAEMMDYSNGLFRFADKIIRCIRLESVGLVPESEDEIFRSSVQEFFAVREGFSIHGYPRGYTSEIHDIEMDMNPTLSVSTMETLGIAEGNVEGLLKVTIMYLEYSRDFLYALRVANLPYVRFAVDEDGSMYMRFRNKYESDMTAIHHFFIGGRKMIKFYKVASVKKRHRAFDSSGLSIYWRARNVES